MPVTLGVSEELAVWEGVDVPDPLAVTEADPVALLEGVFVRLAVWVGVGVTGAEFVVVREGLDVPVCVFIGVMPAVGVPVAY